MNFQNIDLAKAYQQLEQKAMTIYKLSGLSLDEIIELLAKGYEFVPPKNLPEELWEKNLDFLRSGGFGSMKGDEFAETMFRYWKTQEYAGYPQSSENVKYFESLIAERSKR